MNTSLPDRPRFFISYCIDDQKFVREVCNILEPYLHRDRMFLFQDNPSVTQSFLEVMHQEVKASDFVLLFVGKRFGEYQAIEFAQAIAEQKAFLPVGIGGQDLAGFPDIIQTHAKNRTMLQDRYTRTVPTGTVRCAEDVLDCLRDWWQARFRDSWKEWDDKLLLNGLPACPQLFDYEKNIIEFYAALHSSGSTAPSVTDPTTSDTIKRAREKWPDERIESHVNNGVAAGWPDVPRYECMRSNHLDPTLAGNFRSSSVRAAALVGLDVPGGSPTFPEAGPRPELAFPQSEVGRELKVAILVAGGIAPGINAVIDALVQRHHAYQTASAQAGERYKLTIWGIKNGFLAFGRQNALSQHLVILKPQDTIEHATKGGSMLGTSRDHNLLDVGSRHSRLLEIAEALSRDERMIDILYVIGGDGSMKAAHALWQVANRIRPANQPLSVITVPKTMDNDILWVWQSFGFLSAVDESRRIVETLHTEVRSNPRLGIVQLFGSDSGFVVSHAVLASTAGHALLALIPEIKFSALGVAMYLKKRLWENSNPDLEGHSPTAPIDARYPHGLVVMAENAVPEDTLACLGLEPPPGDLVKSHPFVANAYAETAAKFCLTKGEKDEIIAFMNRQKNGLKTEGQTSDIVRKLGLRVMAESIPVFLKQAQLLPLEAQLGFMEPDWLKLRVVCSEPRHLVRSLEPSTTDIITGQRLGVLAVDAAMAGYTDCMISQWLTEFALIPLDLVVLGRKRIPAQGMFWKSVIAKTNQPGNLNAPYAQA